MKYIIVIIILFQMPQIGMAQLNRDYKKVKNRNLKSIVLKHEFLRLDFDSLGRIRKMSYSPDEEYMETTSLDKYGNVLTFYKLSKFMRDSWDTLYFSKSTYIGDSLITQVNMSKEYTQRIDDKEVVIDSLVYRSFRLDSTYFQLHIKSKSLQLRDSSYKRFEYERIEVMREEKLLKEDQISLNEHKRKFQVDTTSWCQCISNKSDTIWNQSITQKLFYNSKGEVDQILHYSRGVKEPEIYKSCKFSDDFLCCYQFYNGKRIGKNLQCVYSDFLIGNKLFNLDRYWWKFVEIYKKPLHSIKEFQKWDDDNSVGLTYY